MKLCKSILLLPLHSACRPRQSWGPAVGMPGVAMETEEPSEKLELYFSADQILFQKCEFAPVVVSGAQTALVEHPEHSPGTGSPTWRRPLVRFCAPLDHALERLVLHHSLSPFLKHFRGTVGPDPPLWTVGPFPIISWA